VDQPHDLLGRPDVIGHTGGQVSIARTRYGPRYADRVEESRPHLGARGEVNARDRAADATARAQHLVDSRPKGAYPLAWCVEAMHVGDLTAIAALQLSDTMLGPN
jgi:hypothetical protein